MATMPLGATSPGLGAMFDTRRARLWAAAYAVTIVGLDLLAAYDDHGYPRFMIGFVAVLVAAHLAARDPRGAASLGLQGLDPAARRWWLRCGAIVGGLALLALATVVGISLARGAPLWTFRPWTTRTGYVVWACLVWPVYEECIYRLTLLPAAVALLGPRGAFVVGAGTCAVLHVVYGNLDPSNVLGAIVLNWAFLRSGSLALSIGLHAAGNAVIVAANLAMHALAT